MRVNEFSCEKEQKGRFFGALDISSGMVSFSQSCAELEDQPPRNRFVCVVKADCYCCIQSTGSVSGGTER